LCELRRTARGALGGKTIGTNHPGVGVGITAENQARRVVHALGVEGMLTPGREQAVLEDGSRLLTASPGVGPVIASTIQYETGDIGRFESVGRYVASCRLVKAEKSSNQRLKGQGLRKNDNLYLSWAFHEAAHFAVRFQPDARNWYQRKRSKACALVGIRALAHRLARAAYFMMGDQAPYQPSRLSG
jgi:transposase